MIYFLHLVCRWSIFVIGDPIIRGAGIQLSEGLGSNYQRGWDPIIRGAGIPLTYLTLVPVTSQDKDFKDYFVVFFLFSMN
jgi:hypothetical protein